MHPFVHRRSRIAIPRFPIERCIAKSPTAIRDPYGSFASPLPTSQFSIPRLTMRRSRTAFTAPLPLRSLTSPHPLTTSKPRKPDFPAHQRSRSRMQSDPPTQPPLLPTLVVEDASSALTYYTTALSATPTHTHRANGRVQHSVLETSYGLRLSIVDYYPGCVVDPLAPGGLMQGLFQHVTVPRGWCDQAVRSMVDAGATLVEGPREVEGRREGKVVDRYGVAWVFGHEL